MQGTDSLGVLVIIIVIVLINLGTNLKLLQIICVALTILCAIETFAKLKAWRGENEPTSRIVQTARPTTEPGLYYEPNEMLQRSQGPEMA